MNGPVLVWLRRDLRLADNPALYHAVNYGAPVIPVFVWAPEEEVPWAMGGAQRWWLHHSLLAFKASLHPYKIPFVIQKGASSETLLRLARDLQARAVLWNRAYEPAENQREDTVSRVLLASGIETQSFESHLLHDPNAIQTGKGGCYKVYTPFWRNVRANQEVLPPLGAPSFSDTSIPKIQPNSIEVDDLMLRPRINWAGGLRKTWQPGEKTALDSMRQFIDSNVRHYASQRDFPSVEGTSKLSPHLHFGEISPRTIWHHISQIPQPSEEHETFLKQLIWREFSYHLLHHFPETATNNLRTSFDHFPWSTDQDMLTKWQKGETGYPIVDAGMKQLWETGWMHNRVRMIVASFLTKHLLIHWLEGAHWFWDTLVDANLANNTMGWQWSAGSGADAQPFFRIFNPISQSKKFDADGKYLKQWLPVLQHVPSAKIHEPWLLSQAEQSRAGFRLGSSYPMPVVDHKVARQRALDAYKAVSK